jgi:guanylate kinase
MSVVTQDSPAVRQAGEKQGRKSGLIDSFNLNVRIITFSGPRGGGKHLILDNLRKRDCRFGTITTVTTRPHFPGDRHGEYSYINKNVFERLEKEHAFQSVMRVGLHGFGITRHHVSAAMQSTNDHPLLVRVSHESVESFHAEYPGQVASFFVLTSQSSKLLERLKRCEPVMSPADHEGLIDAAMKLEDSARKSGAPYTFIDHIGQIDTAVGIVINTLRRTSA